MGCRLNIRVNWINRNASKWMIIIVEISVENS